MKNKPAEKPIHEKCAQAILDGMPPLQSEKQATEVRRLCEIYFLEAEASTKLEQLRGIDDFMKHTIGELPLVWHFIAAKFNPESQCDCHPLDVFVRNELANLPISYEAAQIAEIVTQYFEQKNDAKELIKAASADS